MPPDNRFVASATLRPGIVRVEATLRDFAFPAHSHDHVCLGLVHEGALDCRYGVRRHAVEQGDLMLVNPGEVHDGRPSGRHGRRYSMLEIDVGVFEQLCREMVQRDRFEFQRAVVREPAVRAALAAWLATLAGPDPDAEAEACAVVFGRLTALAGWPSAPSTARGVAERVARRLREDDGGASPFAALARELGISRYALIRAFKHRYGLTPEAYRRQLRVERARRLLAQAPAARLVEIAAEAGFADQSHMTRELRRISGLSPAQYRGRASILS